MRLGEWGTFAHARTRVHTHTHTHTHTHRSRLTSPHIPRPPCAPAQDDNPEAAEADRNEAITGWDAEFVKVDQATLFEMIMAANFLDIKKMLDLTCKAVAEMIKGKTPEEIRKHFNITNDFTPEEEEQVRRENE